MAVVPPGRVRPTRWSSNDAAMASLRVEETGGDDDIELAGRVRGAQQVRQVLERSADEVRFGSGP